MNPTLKEIYKLLPKTRERENCQVAQAISIWLKDRHGYGTICNICGESFGPLFCAKIFTENGRKGKLNMIKRIPSLLLEEKLE